RAGRVSVALGGRAGWLPAEVCSGSPCLGLYPHKREFGRPGTTRSWKKLRARVRLREAGPAVSSPSARSLARAPIPETDDPGAAGPEDAAAVGGEPQGLGPGWGDQIESRLQGKQFQPDRQIPEPHGHVVGRKKVAAVGAEGHLGDCPVVAPKGGE